MAAVLICNGGTFYWHFTGISECVCCFFFFLTGVLRTLVSQDFKFVILLCMAKGWEWPRARFGSWSSKVGFQEALWPFS